MTTHIVCLDGTDQEKDQKYPTNIAKMFDAVGGTPSSADYGSFECSNAQLAGKYLPGVGTQGSPMLKALGNLFGDGIAELIVRGYTYLSRTWRPGDEIVLTGFSRGATAARALGGLISAKGLLDTSRYAPAIKEDAYRRAIAAWYQHRKPDPLLAEQARLEVMKLMTGEDLPKLTAADFIAPPPIKAIVVFDTVSSLGAPNILNGMVRFDFSICDTTLSDNVQYGFHALAADETREMFSPTFWAPRDKVEQVIFAGCHSNVGGGFPDCHLSDIALTWMIARLAGIGIVLDTKRIHPLPAPDPLALIQDDGRRPPFFGLFCKGRSFPKEAMADASLLRRIGQPNNVTPQLLGAYKPAGTYIGGIPL